MDMAPVILFVYNRPEHTRQTLEHLKLNYLSKETELFIYADGPASNLDQKGIQGLLAVRKLISSFKGFKSKTIIEREANLGLAANIVSGVTEIVNKYEKVIVLEDDILTSPGFLTYMNEALRIYENNDEVMHISAYWYPIKSENLPATFFYNVTSCWGWGTWKYSWQYITLDPGAHKSQIEAANRVEEFNIENSENFISHLEKNITGQWRTWAIKWYASVFLRSGYCLHPNKSLVANIGHDGSGENCVENETFNRQEYASGILVEPISIEESKAARKMAIHYLRKPNASISHLGRLKQIAKKILGR